MKLILITVVQEFREEILQLLKKATIDNFSETNIEGFKKNTASISATNWFSGQKSSVQSTLFFSFTEIENVKTLFNSIKIFNANLKTNNPIKAVVVPIEEYI